MFRLTSLIPRSTRFNLNRSNILNKLVTNPIQTSVMGFYSNKPLNDLPVIKKYEDFPLELLIRQDITWKELHTIDKLVLTGQIVFYTPFVIIFISFCFLVWLYLGFISLCIIGSLLSVIFNRFNRR